MPAAMSEARITSLTATATPFSFREPFAGRLVMVSDRKLFAGLSLVSVKPKSVVAKV